MQNISFISKNSELKELCGYCDFRDVVEMRLGALERQLGFISGQLCTRGRFLSNQGLGSVAQDKQGAEQNVQDPHIKTLAARAPASDRDRAVTNWNKSLTGIEKAIDVLGSSGWTEQAMQSPAAYKGARFNGMKKSAPRTKNSGLLGMFGDIS